MYRSPLHDVRCALSNDYWRQSRAPQELTLSHPPFVLLGGNKNRTSSAILGIHHFAELDPQTVSEVLAYDDPALDLDFDIESVPGLDRARERRRLRDLRSEI